jgi:DNA helicase TIP49 (TBP-interacting protein)
MTIAVTSRGVFISVNHHLISQRHTKFCLNLKQPELRRVSLVLHAQELTLHLAVLLTQRGMAAWGAREAVARVAGMVGSAKVAVRAVAVRVAGMAGATKAVVTVAVAREVAARAAAVELAMVEKAEAGTVQVD